MTGTANCYAVRRLNPFLGVIEVMEIDGARALSIDGISWQIEVEAERPEHTWGRDAPGKTVRQFFRFGSWHRETGLGRVPVNPILDVGVMLAASERIIATLEALSDTVPFPFTDRFEHWLLDDQQQPLALLAATVDQRFISEIKTDQWLATAPLSSDFASASLTALKIPASDPQGKRHHADMLERQIHAAAGASPRRCWYERQADGSALPLSEGFAALPDKAFPKLPWREHWPDATESALLQDYQAWLAPQLLTLTGLGEALRRTLEQAACRQATQMADQYRLYPTVLQPDLLDTARVEARLRRSAG